MKVDTKWIEQCIKGDKKAQLRLYDHCYSYMMSICLRYTKDRQDAASRLNLAFLKVLRHLDQFDHSGSFKAWVSRITVRSIIDEFRSQQRHYQLHAYYGQPGQEIQWPDDEMNPIAEEINLDHLLALINTLPEMCKAVFNLYAIDGYTHKEIGVMLGMSEGTSKWHLHEARKKLKDMLLREYKTASLK
jgi:RNA polymerase sigma-70 factor (ECF subfamily)